MVMPRPSSSGLQSIRRELQRRKHKAALAPTRPASKKCLDQSPRSSPEQDPSPTISRSSGFAPPAAPPSRSVSSSVGYARAATGNTASHMNPGTTVQVRTRSQMVIDGRTIVLWLPATVVSAADDDGGYYEVIYEGNLPREDPFSTVRVPPHHVRPVKPSPPLSQPSSATTSPENQGTQPAPRPTTAGKSPRLLGKLAPPEMKPAPRPTTAGKSIHVVRRIMAAEKERQALDSCCLGY